MGRIEQALKRASSHEQTFGWNDDERERSRRSTSVEEYPREGDARIRSTPGRVERSAGAPVHVAVVPRPLPAAAQATPIRNAGGKLVTDAGISPAALEQYRRLAVTLHQIKAERPFKVLMVSSALPLEGKTLTSVNVALTLSESYKSRVLLIDADLRRPSLHSLFALPNTKGLSDTLRGAEQPLPTLSVSNQLTVVLAGRADRDPIAGLTSQRMRDILSQAAEQFDWIILDTPPVGLISDARLLANLTDGVLLVTGAGSTDYKVVRNAIDELGRARIVGAVLNRVDEDLIAPSGYYGDYYGETDRGARA